MENKDTEILDRIHKWFIQIGYRTSKEGFDSEKVKTGKVR